MSRDLTAWWEAPTPNSQDAIDRWYAESVAFYLANVFDTDLLTPEAAVQLDNESHHDMVNHPYFASVVWC